MPESPVYTAEDIALIPPFDVPTFDRDDAIQLGLTALEVIWEFDANLAVEIVVADEVVFVAKTGTTGAGNDPWLAGKAAVAKHFGEPSLLVRLRHEGAGIVFADLPGLDHEVLRAHGGSIPIFVAGVFAGTITMSGEPDTVDHAAAAEAIRRFLAL